jgi:hypothetical protein
MTARSTLLFVLGLWLGCTVFMWLVATQNFAVVEAIRSADNSGFSAAASDLSPENLRLVLRYQASEVNRLFFNGWGLAQLLIALAAIVLAWRAKLSRVPLALIAVMVVIVVVLQGYVVPETIRLGRLLDFVPREPAPPEAAPFWRLHHTYTGLDMLKFLLGLAAAWFTARGAGKPQSG